MNFTADQIMQIPVLEPERLFGTPDSLHDSYKSLARRWHPDVQNGDAGVFTHIGQLYERAKHLVNVGMWHVPGIFEFSSKGKQYRVHYIKSFDFELGTAYVGNTRLTYVIANEFADMMANARKTISELKFPDAKTKDVMSMYLPTINGFFETPTHTILSIDKPNDLIRLRDLLDHLKEIDPKHVAWMVSRMLNHACYLELSKLSHGDFSLDTLFVCPEHHTICLLGGWWYSAEFDQSLKGRLLPQRTISYGPSELITKKLASSQTDLELLRLTAREMLGDASGARLTANKDIPAAMTQWLRLSSAGSAVKDYFEWRDKILPASFGPRRFVPFPINAKDVYAELE